MELQILEQSDTLTRVALIGMLDMVAVGEIETRFADATIPRGKTTVVDVSRMSFIASLGMGMLINAMKRLKRQGGRLLLLDPQADVELALSTARLTELIPLAHGEAELTQLLAEAV